MGAGDVFEFWEGRDGRGYWHRRARSGKVSDQSQGYSRVRDAGRMARRRAEEIGARIRRLDRPPARAHRRG